MSALAKQADTSESESVVDRLRDVLTTEDSTSTYPRPTNLIYVLVGIFVLLT